MKTKFYGFSVLQNIFPVLQVTIMVVILLSAHSGASTTTIIQADNIPDRYELDDTPANAVQFNLSAICPQVHNFHKQGDEDWIKFHALKDETIYIKTFDPGEKSQTVITLFAGDGLTQITENRLVNTEGENLLSWNFWEDGIYYVKITHDDPEGYGTGTIYSLWIYRPIIIDPETEITIDKECINTGYMEGMIINSESGNPVDGVTVKTGITSTVGSMTSPGYYILECPVGDVTVTAFKTGYEIFSTEVKIEEASRLELNIALTPSYIYNSTYELIQWPRRDKDTHYCIDLCDLAGNAYPGLESIVCEEDMNAWSPKQYININLGIPDSALSGFQFMWKIRSFSGYGGEEFKGSLTVP